MNFWALWTLELWILGVSPTLWNKSFDSEKIQPILIPSKIMPIGLVDFNSKIKFAICHWTWEIGWIWHFLRKSGDKILVISGLQFFLTRYRAYHYEDGHSITLWQVEICMLDLVWRLSWIAEMWEFMKM